MRHLFPKNEVADGLVSIALYYSWGNEVILMNGRQTEMKVFRIRNKAEKVSYLLILSFFFFFPP